MISYQLQWDLMTFGSSDMSDSVRNSMGPGSSFSSNAFAEFAGSSGTDLFRGKELRPEEILDVQEYREFMKGAW